LNKRVGRARKHMVHHIGGITDKIGKEQKLGRGERKKGY